MSTAALPPPMPELEPLQLLYVTNGSPLTADRWWLAHHYYQHRQNLHYQSLYQPGIVQGLGVRSIAPPDTVPSDLRDDRWIEIQPGLAIDLVGHPIVVEQAMPFRIAAEVIETPITVYVVLAYVNPRAKQWSGIPADVVKEEFRINERLTPPAPNEIELCRIHLTHNDRALQNAATVLQPAAHGLDLRYRQRVQARSLHPIQVGLVETATEVAYRDRLMGLLHGIDALYPGLSSPKTITLVALENASHPAARLPDLTLLFLPYRAIASLSEAARDHLRAYVQRGGTVLVEYSDEQGGNADLPGEQQAFLSDLQTVRGELLAALLDLETVEAGSELDRVQQELMAELVACEAALQEQRQAIAQPIRALTLSDDETSSLSQSPPSLPNQQPFLFDELPQLPTGAVQLVAWEGVILVMGSLSAAWTTQQFDQPLSREALRSAQELGINILYQACRRQQMMQAQRATTLPEDLQ
jgi:hypothetical protein